MTDRSVAQIRADVMRSRRRYRLMVWLFSSQCGVGAFAVLLTGGGWGWSWFVIGFLGMLTYTGFITLSNHTLMVLEGLPDDTDGKED